MSRISSPMSGTRRIGLTTRTGYKSLHGDHLQKTRESNASVFAPPEDSSDDITSEDSEFGRIENSEKPSGYALPRRRSANGEDGKRRELSVEPSNIRAGSFTSSKGPNGSQSSQKRKNTDFDDDLPHSFSQQQKKPRLSYSHGGMNKHNGMRQSGTKPVNRTKVTAAKENIKAGHTFKTPQSNDMLARLDQSQQAKPMKFKRPPSPKNASFLQNSQRDQRASQRSAKSTQESPQSSARSFKQPPRPSPKKAPQFKQSPVVSEDFVRAGATRFREPRKTAPVLAEDDALKPSKLQNAFSAASDKLGLSTMRLNLPPSTTTCDSSAPPTPLDTATTVSSPLTSLDGSSEDGYIIASKDIKFSTTADSALAVCPMCQQPVEKSYLEGFAEAGTRMSLRRQGLFCKAHKERRAESEWAERGYPQIAWDSLDARIAKLHHVLDDVLSGRNRSFYRNAFEDSLKSGKHRTVQESLMGGEIEGASTGYYGGRGAKVMADNIMSRFARKLRRLAASDKLIASGGVSRYVQAVLVPELAVRLIRDDMKLDDDDEEKAREVLRESGEIGNLLNEEEEDEIVATESASAPREVVEVGDVGDVM